MFHLTLSHFKSEASVYLGVLQLPNFATTPTMYVPSQPSTKFIHYVCLLSQSFNLIHNKCDRVCEKGSYERIQFCNFEEA